MTLNSIIAKHVSICTHGKACEDCCHLWLGSKCKGYGQVSYNGKIHIAHRLIYALTYEITLVKTDHICHKVHCNNPLCCNVHHLYKGTAKSNGMDRSKYNIERCLRGQGKYKLMVSLMSFDLEVI